MMDTKTGNVAARITFAKSPLPEAEVHHFSITIK
jgi:hypothetical protein